MHLKDQVVKTAELIRLMMLGAAVLLPTLRKVAWCALAFYRTAPRMPHRSVRLIA